MTIRNKKKNEIPCCHCVKKILFNWAALSTMLRHCIIFEKKFILSVSYNNEDKSKVTLQFPLAKGSFN